MCRRGESSKGRPRLPGAARPNRYAISRAAAGSLDQLGQDGAGAFALFSSSIKRQIDKNQIESNVDLEVSQPLTH
jgi:hypothetical protein